MGGVSYVSEDDPSEVGTVWGTRSRRVDGEGVRFKDSSSEVVGGVEYKVCDEGRLRLSWLLFGGRKSCGEGGSTTPRWRELSESESSDKVVSETCEVGVIDPKVVSETCEVGVIDPKVVSETCEVGVIGPKVVSETCEVGVIDPKVVSETCEVGVIDPGEISFSVGGQVGEEASDRGSCEVEGCGWEMGLGSN